MKKLIILFLIFGMMGMTGSLWAQGQQETADAFLKRVSNNYAKIVDYRARIIMTKQGAVQQGTLYYVAPDRLKIEYTSPAKQILLITSDFLQLYLPQYEVIMEQKLTTKDIEGMGGIGVGRGLEIMQKNYSVSYVNSARPQPLSSGSSEMVVKLQMKWRVNNEGFRTLEMSVDPQTLLIRRVVGVTSMFETLQFDFLNIRLNSNIPKTLFVMELDDTSRVNRYPDFIYGTEAP